MAANMVLLEKITVGAAGASSVTFSGIPQTGYTDLILKSSVRAENSSSQTWVINYLEFNGDTGANYTAKYIQGSGSGVSSNNLAAMNGVTTGSGAVANIFGNTEMYIPNYTSSNYKSYSSDYAMEDNASLSFAGFVAGLWSSTAAITSIRLSSPGNILTNSTFYLYGVAALGTTPVIVPYATGGNTIMTDGSYWYHTFVSSGTFTPAKALSVDYLVVAGGGGGGNFSGAGGGAGGLRCTVTATGGGGSLESPLSLTAQAYTVTVGAGGASSSGASDTSTSGSNSVFSTITSTGGGYGSGAATPRVGANGGSGGGGGYNYAPTGFGTGTANQGYAGGPGLSGNPYQGGGGGGANAVGTTPTYAFPSQVNGVGGAGVATSISGSSVTYAGGGGASTGGNAAAAGQTGGAGGAGGGGAGGNIAPSYTNGTAGTANLGGGGGGGGSTTSSLGSATSGAGGSGIVIVRYAV